MTRFHSLTIINNKSLNNNKLLLKGGEEARTRGVDEKFIEN